MEKKKASDWFEEYSKLSKEYSAIDEKIKSLMKTVEKEKDKSLGKKAIQEMENLHANMNEIYDKQHLALHSFLQIFESTFFEDQERQLRRQGSTPTFSRKASVARITNSLGDSSSSNGSQKIEGSIVSSQWEIDPSDIVINESNKIGRGQFGTVYKAKISGKEVAVKKMLVQMFNDEKTREDFIRETQVMSTLRHPNLLLILGACTKPENLMIVTEFMSKGSVYNLLHPKNPDAEKLPQRRRWLIAKQVAQGMSWLHKIGYVHLDLKTENLLVDENFVVKIADFGLSRIVQDASKERVGSPLYMAPEVLRRESYDQKADVYSFGIILWELLTGKDPYEGTIKNITSLFQNIVVEGKRPNMPEGVTQRLRDLIVSCWSPSPFSRPLFSDMLSENVFDEIIIDTVILDSLARFIWRQRFFGKWAIPWEEFLEGFLQGLRAPSKKYTEQSIHVQLFKCVLSRKFLEKFIYKSAGIPEEKLVTIENFGNALSWFGPLDIEMLERVNRLLHAKYFFGYLSSVDAEKILMSEKDKGIEEVELFIESLGSFILRFSSEPGKLEFSIEISGYYTLSSVTKDNEIMHFRIQYVNTHFVLGKTEYETIESVLKSKQLSGHHVSPNIKKPVSISTPYEKMTQEHNRKIHAVGYFPSDD